MRCQQTYALTLKASLVGLSYSARFSSVLVVRKDFLRALLTSIAQQTERTVAFHIKIYPPCILRITIPQNRNAQKLLKAKPVEPTIHFINLVFLKIIK